MKTLLLLLFLSTSFLIADDDLIAYWSFDDETANDHSGHGYNGTIMFHPKFVPGVKGKAIWFQGRGYYAPVNDIREENMGDHVLLPYIDFQSMNEFTVSMWVREEGMSSPGGEGYIWFGHVQQKWFGILNHVFYGQDNRFVHFTVGSYDTDNCISVKSDTSYMNKWVYYAMVYKNGILKAYIDGKFISQKNINIFFNHSFAALARHWWKYSCQERTSARFTGAMDEVKIFRKALTDEEIKDDYGAIDIKFSIPDTIVSIGENICLPLTVSTLNNDISIDSINYSLTVSYEKSILWPSDNNWGTINENDREIKLNGVVYNINNTPKKIHSLCGIVLLGNQKTTSVLISDIEVKNPNVFVTKKDGSITTNGVCQQNIARIQKTDVPNVNIFQKKDKIELNIDVKNNTFLYYSLYNIRGEQIIHNIYYSVSTGKNIFLLSTSDLPLGVYFITLNINNLYFSKAINILH